jgi:Mlc titration factor MtfA (ptsG expression regulator)
MPNPLHKIIGAIISNKNTDSIPAAYKELSDITRFEHETVSKYISYYNQLPDVGKLRFLKRIYYFKNSKHFHYVDLEEKPEMPVLLSAAAVQLTFGLRSYLLPFFKDIYLIADAYRAENIEGLNVGHVSTTGIYISWKYLLEGFKNDRDGVNTAIHEMAHALRHQNNMREFGIDKEFHTDFAKYTQQYGPALIQALLHRRSILRNYAFTNFEEFWAVSVEAFFELPQELKTYLPGIYHSLCEVLNQDPLTEKKVLSSPARKS